MDRQTAGSIQTSRYNVVSVIIHSKGNNLQHLKGTNATAEKMAGKKSEAPSYQSLLLDNELLYVFKQYRGYFLTILPSYM